MIGGGGPQVDQRTDQRAQGSGTGGGTAGGTGSGEGTRDGIGEGQPAPASPEAPKPKGLFSDAPASKRDSAKGLPSTGESQTPGSAVPAGADPAAAQAQGGSDGKGVGNDPSKPEEASSANGATRAEQDAATQGVEGAKDAGESSTESGDNEAKRVGSNAIDLPELEVEVLKTDDYTLERAGDNKPIDVHPIAGVWEQIDGPNSADFGPGGYERSIVMLNPSTRVAAIYRVFRGSIRLVIGGELALDAPRPGANVRAGELELRVDPSLPSKFATTRVPLGGTPPQFAEPPTGASPWRLTWKREQQQLVIGGKRYTPTTLDAFEDIRRGGGDVAAPDEVGELAPQPRKGATAARGPKPKEAAFFGVRGGGKRFVFIVDVSGSMQGPKLDRMKDELTKSVRALATDAEFSVVFFAGGAEVIDQGWMKASTDKARAVALIGQQGCLGGTDPTEAFNFAFKSLSPIPDCIFFMTDGQIPPWIPANVRTLNSARIPTEIHSIIIGTAQEEPVLKPLMEQIANENRGTYTFVPQ